MHYAVFRIPIPISGIRMFLSRKDPVPDPESFVLIRILIWIRIRIRILPLTSQKIKINHDFRCFMTSQ